MSHQAYLEAPYVNASLEEEAFEKWCEANDVDPEADDAWEQFDDFRESQYEDVPEPPEDWDRDPRDYS